MTRRPRWPVLLAFALGGCTGTVQISGTIEASPEDGSGVSGVDVIVRDADDVEIARATSGSGGRFEVEIDRGQHIEVVLDDGAQRPVSFKGESGLEPTFEIPSGTFFLMPEAWLADFMAPFEGCPDAGLGDGLVLGQSALDVDVDDGVARPPEPCTFAFLEDASGETRVDACYTSEKEDEEGVYAYDPDAEVVGRTGRFLIPGVSGGPWRFVVGRYQDCGTGGSNGALIGETFVHIPEGGVLPRLPALVPL